MKRRTPTTTLEAMRRWRADPLNREKWLAHAAVRRAKSRRRSAWGPVLEAQPCAVCGSEYRPHGHHEDHTSWWDVLWVCNSCHSKHHHGALELPEYAHPEPVWRLGVWQTPEWVEVADRELLDSLHGLLATLHPREASIAMRREHGDTLEELGKRWGITRERVRQIEARLHRDMREKLERFAA